VLTFRKRVSSLILVAVVLSISPAALCGGWLSAPEARLACCSEGGMCPMHKSDPNDPTAMTQAQADSCCAASEKRDSSPPTATAGLLVPLALVASPVRFSVPAGGAQLDAWRTLVPIPGTHVPRHLLLSVFLV
jgi:hypothetical protein